MSKDIRSFFSRTTKPKIENGNGEKANKKRAPPMLSDDDDFIPESPQLIHKVVHKKRKILDSSDEEENVKIPPKQPPEVKSKPQEVKPVDVFGKQPVKRVKSDKPESVSKKNIVEEECAVHDHDKNFAETIKRDTESFKNLHKIVEKSPKKTDSSKDGRDKGAKGSRSPSKKSESNGKNTSFDKEERESKKSNGNVDKKRHRSPSKKTESKENINCESKNVSPSKSKHKPKLSLAKSENKEKLSPTKSKDKEKSSPTKSKDIEKLSPAKVKDEKEVSPANTGLKRDFSVFINGDSDKSAPETSQTTPKSAKKTKKEKSPELTEEEKMERRRHSAALYKTYLNRSGPKNPGSKVIPEGKPSCLSGLSFLVTGEMESLDRNEITEIIKKYGGDIKTGVTGKVSYVIHGADAGPAKMAKAEQLHIPLLTEDEFLQLIKERSEKDLPEVQKPPPKQKKTPVKKDRKASPVKKDKKASPVKKDKKASPVKVEEKEVEMKVSPNENQINNSNIAWVDKYKPHTLKGIIGQQSEACCAAKLHKWLSNWYKSRKLKLAKPTPWSKGDGGYFKAALLSGPPGVGKTTTVSIVCKELGFDIVEYNASDTRSKSLLADKLTTQMSTTSLMPYFQGKTSKGAVTKKHVIVMDEVDGMAGNEDRGGMQELINMTKESSVPIICMCNDKTSPKMRSFLNYCYDLTFPKPKVEQIKAAMRSICFKEGIDIPVTALHELIVGANQDIRQTINLLSLWSATDKKLSSDDVSNCTKQAKKDIKIGPWDVVRKVFSSEEHKTMSIHDKSDLFFYDYSMSPLFVQQNYLKVEPKDAGNKREALKRFAEAADCISMGDIVENKIRKNMAWSLLPVQAMYSSVLPGTVLSGHIKGQIDFPSWLGQNSRNNKMSRLIQELHSHTGLSTSGGKEAMALDYAVHIRDAILNPLIKKGTEGIREAMAVMEAYNLLREDLDSLIELTHWSGTKDPAAMLDSKTKAAFTRTYNKEAAPLPYSQISVKKSRATENATGEEDMPLSDEEPEEESSDIENDAMIKVPKKTSIKKSEVPQKKPKGKEKATSSKKTKK